jgi:uncharacterized protein (DUF2147 family)
MFMSIRTVTLAAAGLIIWSSGSHAMTTDPTGLWFDHNGRGAVEIAPCASGNGYCGYVVHIKEAKNAKRCGLQILGNVTTSGGGWIYSPERGKKYSVELTRMSDDKLRVVGNAGSFFSKTFTWNRAPDDVARCGAETAAAPAKPIGTKTDASASSASQAPEENAAEPAMIGAASGAMALIGAPKKKRVAVAEATPAAVDTEPASAVTKEKAPAATEPAQTAAAPAATEDEESFVPERKCKFKIPYVGRVIDVPCRD